jgi:hypothetical protein
MHLTWIYLEARISPATIGPACEARERFTTEVHGHREMTTREEEDPRWAGEEWKWSLLWSTLASRTRASR